MASPITTVSDIAAPVDVVLQRTFLSNAKARCPYFVGSESAEIAEHAGSFTAKWRRYENLTPTTSALTALTGNVAFPTRTAVQPTVTDITKAVSKYGNYILLNEEVDIVNPSNQSSKLSEVMGINAGQSLNRLQRNELEDNATLTYAGGTTDGTTDEKIGRGHIDYAVNVLDRNDAMYFLPRTEGNRAIGTAPIREAYWGLCHVDVEYDIRNMTGFQDVATYAGQTTIASGEFGTIGRVRWVCSSEGSIDTNVGATGGTDLRETTASKTDLYSSVIFGKEAVGSLGLGMKHVKEIYMAGDKLPGAIMISKAKGSAGVADALDELTSLGWKSWHGAKILNSNWIYGIRSGATDLSN
jgi:N4-gp56 family major capsid protein